MRCRQPLPLLLCLLFCQPAWAQVSPESAEKYNAGQELFEKRRYQQALQAFEEAVKLDGNNAQAYRGMAKTYQKLKDTDKAIGNFRMAATVKPDYVEANYELGNLYFNLKKYKDAQEAFKKVLNLDANFQDGGVRKLLKAAYAKQGREYLGRKNYRKAIEEYENATQLDPTDATNYYNLGLAARQSRKHRQAENAFTTAVELNPKYAKAHRQLGDLYRITKKNSRAIRSYNRAINSDPNCKDKKNINAYRSLALVYNRTKQFSKAVATLRKAVAVAPTRERQGQDLHGAGILPCTQEELQNRGLRIPAGAGPVLQRQRSPVPGGGGLFRTQTIPERSEPRQTSRFEPKVRGAGTRRHRRCIRRLAAKGLESEGHQ